jgi:hypothetical protein
MHLSLLFKCPNNEHIGLQLQAHQLTMLQYELQPRKVFFVNTEGRRDPFMLRICR